jgi:iron complex outermembrane receptor protein
MKPSHIDMIASAALLSIAMTMPAHADDTKSAAEPTADPAADPTADRDQSKIIVNGILSSAGVTATKTDVPIIDTPVNVQSVTAATLIDQGVVSIDQALVNISGVTVGGGGGADDGQHFSTIIIRGFGNDTHFRNGVRLDSFGSDSGTSMVQVANIETLDVLKGPAAILYGQVEPGGIVNVVTKQPLASAAYAAEVQGGSYGFYRGVADATGPLSSDGSVLYRLIGSWEDAGSPTQFGINHTTFVAPSLSFAPSSRDKVTIEVEYRAVDEGQDYGYHLALNGVPQLGDIHTSYGENSPLKEVTWLTDLRWNHRFSSDWALTAQELYQAISVNGAGIFPYYLQTDPTFPSGLSVGRFVNHVFDHDYTLSTNLDLVGHFSTGAIRHTLLIGADFVHFTYDGGIDQIGQLDPTVASYVDAIDPVHPGTAFGDTLSPYTLGTQLESTAGVYVQDQATLPYGVHVLAGARWQWVRETQTFGYLAAPTPSPTLQGSRITPRLGLLWEALPGINVYGNYTVNFGASNGYAQIYNAADPANSPVVPPTSAHQWEVGVKLASADKRFSATIDWYNLTKTNLPQPDPAHPGFSILIGEARSQGLEFDGQATLVPGWQVLVNYAYTIARDVIPDTELFGEVPRHLAHLWTTYAWQKGMLNGLKLGGGLTVHGAECPIIWDGDYTHPDIPGYQTVDLMMAYPLHLAGHKVTAQINAANVFDKRYFSDIQWAGFPSAVDAAGNTWAGITAIYGAPRMVTGSLRMEF